MRKGGKMGKNFYFTLLAGLILSCGLIQSLESAEVTKETQWYYGYDGSDPETVGLWHFDELKGNVAKDSSKKGNDGLFQKAKWSKEIKKFGEGAISLDGLKEYIEIKDNPSLHLKQFTLEAWIYPTEECTTRKTSMIICKMETYKKAAANHWLRLEKGYLCTGFWGWTSKEKEKGHWMYVRDKSTPIPANCWTHVAGTYDGEALRLYLNGREIAYRVMSSQYKVVDSENALPVVIGRALPYTDYGFIGVVDEIRISKVAREFEPIEKKGYQSSFWHFDEANGQCVRDVSEYKVGILGESEDKDEHDPEWVKGKSGSCLFFDGNDYVKVPDHLDLNIRKDENFTVELWIKTEKEKIKGSRCAIITKYPGTKPAWYLWLNKKHGTIDFWIRDIDEITVKVRSESDVADGKWHHIKAVRDVGTHKIYIFIDGAMENEAIDATTGTFENKCYVLIGETHLRYSGPFWGCIDEVKIYKKGLTSENSQNSQSFNWEGLQPDKKGKLICQVTKNSPIIDGKLDDSCWKEANKVLLVSNKGWDIPSEKTVAAVICDEKNFYIGFKCYESKMNEIKANALEYNGPVWSDDVVEIFLDTNHNRSTYYHFGVNSLGTRVDGGAYSGNWKAKAHRDKDFWSVEVVIPFEGLVGSDTKNTWTMNLNRSGRVYHQLSCWQPTYGGFHAPDKFGEIVFKDMDFARIYQNIVKDQQRVRKVLSMTKDYIVQLTSPNKKVLKNEKIKGLKEIKLYAAKNEYEPFQLLISPKGEGKLGDFSLRFSDLLGDDGKVIKKEHIKYYEVGYIEEIPDVLFPSGEFSGERGNSKLFWIVLHIPTDARGGEYKGEIKIIPDKGKSCEVNIGLKVWNFTLPKKDRIKTCLFSIWPQLIALWYEAPIGSEKYNKLVSGVFETFATHRIDPDIAVPGGWWEFGREKAGAYWRDSFKSVAKFEDGIYGKDALSYFDKWANFWVSNGLELNYIIMSPTDRTLDTPEKMINLERFWNIWYPHLEEKGWADRMYIRPFGDEFEKPGKMWTAAKEGRERALLVKKIAPKIKVLATVSGEFHKINEYINDVVDIWSLNSYLGDKGKIAYFKERQKEGDLVCPYIHGNVMLTNSALKLRGFFWELWRDKADGCTLWSVNFWAHDPTFSSYFAKYQNMEKKSDGSFKVFSQRIKGAGGTLLWPGKKEILGSIRLELIRDGIEDYEFLRILSDKLKSQRCPESIKKEIEQLLENIRNNFWNLLKDSDSFCDIRQKIGSLIERVEKYN